MSNLQEVRMDFWTKARIKAGHVIDDVAVIVFLGAIVFLVIGLLSGCAPNRAEEGKKIGFDGRLVGIWETKDLGPMPDSIYCAGRDDLGKAEIVFNQDSTYRLSGRYSVNGELNWLYGIIEKGRVFTCEGVLAIIGRGTWLEGKMKADSSLEFSRNIYFLNEIESLLVVYPDPTKGHVTATYDSVFDLREVPDSEMVVREEYQALIEYSKTSNVPNLRNAFLYDIVGDSLKTWSMGRLMIWKRKAI